MDDELYFLLKKINPDLTDNATLRNLREPVALFFSYVDASLFTHYFKCRNSLLHIKNKSQQQLIEYLRERKYPAVSDREYLAEFPGSVVVSEHGVQTPFLEPQTARDFAHDLVEYIDRSGFAKPLSYVLGVRIEQMPPPVISDGAVSPDKKFLIPDRRMQEYIVYVYGKDFEERMLESARRHGTDIGEWLKSDAAGANLFSGRRSCLDRYSIQARNNLESRNVIFATNYKNASRYARDKGIIHQFKPTENQEMFDDYAVEMGLRAESLKKKRIETIITPDNEYVGAELFMQDRRFEIPLRREDWQAFLELHRAVYAPDSEHLKNRRINQLLEAKMNDSRAVARMPIGISFAKMQFEYEMSRPPYEITMEDIMLTPQTRPRIDLDRLVKKVREILRRSDTSEEDVKFAELLDKLNIKRKR